MGHHRCTGCEYAQRNGKCIAPHGWCVRWKQPKKKKTMSQQTKDFIRDAKFLAEQREVSRYNEFFNVHVCRPVGKNRGGIARVAYDYEGRIDR